MEKFATVAKLSLLSNTGQASTGVASALHSVANGDAAMMSGQGIIDDDWSCCESFHDAVVLSLHVTDGVARNTQTYEHRPRFETLNAGRIMDRAQSCPDRLPSATPAVWFTHCRRLQCLWKECYTEPLSKVVTFPGRSGAAVPSAAVWARQGAQYTSLPSGFEI